MIFINSPSQDWESALLKKYRAFSNQEVLTSHVNVQEMKSYNLFFSFSLGFTLFFLHSDLKILC